MQLREDSVDAYHGGVLAAHNNTGGSTILNMAEAEAHGMSSCSEVRRTNWASIMAGASGVQVV